MSKRHATSESAPTGESAGSSRPTSARRADPKAGSRSAPTSGCSCSCWRSATARDAQAVAQPPRAARRCRRWSTKTSTIRAAIAVLTVAREPDGLRRRGAAAAQDRSVRDADAQAGIHHVRAHVLARLRAGSARRADRPAAADRAQSRLALGDLVSAPPQRHASRSCRTRSSARFSPSTARSAWRSAPATTRTTSGSRATASTATTTTSSSA